MGCCCCSEKIYVAQNLQNHALVLMMPIMPHCCWLALHVFPLLPTSFKATHERGKNCQSMDKIGGTTVCNQSKTIDQSKHSSLGNAISGCKNLRGCQDLPGFVWICRRRCFFFGRMSPPQFPLTRVRSPPNLISNPRLRCGQRKEKDLGRDCTWNIWAPEPKARCRNG